MSGKAAFSRKNPPRAHAVGLKQTILFPFVTLGSLINFCDCLMGGGTSRRNHSEVGSSFIHFNYTPRQDKATASLLGDVPRGVMLDQPPIFLGGREESSGPSGWVSERSFPPV
jgi:UDP-N-acetylglucosamine/UDP-N-acetylgalactosamine diphosphorylase